MDRDRAYLLYLSYSYWLKGEPLPVDVFQQIVDAGEDPCWLEEEWADGVIPVGDEMLPADEEENGGGKEG